MYLVVLCEIWHLANFLSRLSTFSILSLVQTPERKAATDASWGSNQEETCRGPIGAGRGEGLRGEGGVGEFPGGGGVDTRKLQGTKVV